MAPNSESWGRKGSSGAPEKLYKQHRESSIAHAVRIIYTEDCLSEDLAHKEENIPEFGGNGILSSTRDWHLHPFTIIIVEIYTPSKKRHHF